MGGIPAGSDSTAAKFLQLLDEAARGTALKFMLPWDLGLLRECGIVGLQVASAHLAENPGLPPANFASKYVYNQVMAGGERRRAQRDASGEKYPQPSGQQVAKALETFSAPEWLGFIYQFGRADLDVLRKYLDANKDDILQTLDHMTYWRVLEAVVTRGMILHLNWAAKKRRRFIRYTDALYAAHWRESRRKQNTQGLSYPSQPRSLMETASNRAIAEALSRGGEKVSEKQVANIFKRMAQTPFEKFDGEDPSDYWLIITDARAYNRYMRQLKHSPE
jgi:hypothetical protein